MLWTISYWSPYLRCMLGIKRIGNKSGFMQTVSCWKFLMKWQSLLFGSPAAAPDFFISSAAVLQQVETHFPMFPHWIAWKKLQN